MAKTRFPTSRKTIYKWNLKMLCELIIEIIHNKFDCFLIIEGSRGLGKSTLGYEILSRVSRYMKASENENKQYIFRPKKDILYTQNEVLDAVTKRKYDSFLMDEMINCTFNRDFYNESQKKIIKALNMNRDFCNLIVSCVPKFATLDNQIRNLCRMRITVIRRGLAIVHTPVKSIYETDIWQTKVNQKIEANWVSGNISKPKYSRLTTFRGILKFPDLKTRQRELYEEIKNEKRNIIIAETEVKGKKNETPAVRIHRLLDEGKIKTDKEYLTTCLALNVKPSSVRSSINRILRDNMKDVTFRDYFTKSKEEIKKINEPIPSVLQS